ncbi:MAG: GTPase HflX [Oscillospiraceae bacterium]|nr:GTPase HflX [Oscillospiraceae bacterium]
MLDNMQNLNPERAVLAAVDTGAYDAEESLEELSELARTAGAEVVFTVVQKRGAPDRAGYLGAGKLEELKELCGAQEANLLVCDDELSPSQLRFLVDQLNPDHKLNPEDKLNIRVIDRTMLILDIFAARAKSSEGKLQVELAQLKYNLPRLRGQWMGLSRQGGGIGTRGPGETNLETDRRVMRARIRRLEEDLERLRRRRELQRARRRKNGVESVAIVGYTNVGKSTLMNALTDAGVLAEDKLFATLDPTARALRLPDGREVMLIDTVGLVRRLPHHLVEAFHSTLEEALNAALILNVCDISHPECAEQMRVTTELLHQLGCDEAGIPVLHVLNKCDLVPPEVLSMPVIGGGVHVSALENRGLEELLVKISALLPPGRRRVSLLLPYALSGQSARIRAEGALELEEFRMNGLYIEAVLPFRMIEELGEYVIRD